MVSVERVVSLAVREWCGNMVFQVVTLVALGRYDHTALEAGRFPLGVLQKMQTGAPCKDG